MREFLFRGKRKDNGEWVEGFYFCMVHEDGRHVHHFIIPLGTDLNLGTPIEKIQVEADPETICQYTGMTDKDGRKIFEGDIVKVLYTDGQEDDGDVVEVRYSEKTASFSPWDWQYECDGCDLYLHIKEVEVIGNIFDNPELIGAKT